ncbi:hypothetical protein HW115_09775 [Verrucomicrobiaceae bacterium N1E253]|uniref:Uncharacterized protein n=1 Tax=Oceaniferula marina TaxID=2748318 RepID=A0A851GM72_9BACT|nr:hypothetical protein [Oceaniferula marina]NWK55900.1 hypothetical protein [Oceaniferula marina]
MTAFFKFCLLIVTVTPFCLTTSSCVVKQTTTRDGAVVDEKYIIKRPVKKFIQNAEFE